MDIENRKWRSTYRAIEFAVRRFCPVACCNGEGLMRQFCSFARVVREEREDREKEKRTEEMIRIEDLLRENKETEITI